MIFNSQHTNDMQAYIQLISDLFNRIHTFYEYIEQNRQKYKWSHSRNRFTIFYQTVFFWNQLHYFPSAALMHVENYDLFCNKEKKECFWIEHNMFRLLWLCDLYNNLNDRYCALNGKHISHYIFIHWTLCGMFLNSGYGISVLLLREVMLLFWISVLVYQIASAIVHLYNMHPNLSFNSVNSCFSGKRLFNSIRS